MKKCAHARTQNGGDFDFVREAKPQKKKKAQHLRLPSRDGLSHKSRTHGHQAQQHPGEQDFITKLLAELSHSAFSVLQWAICSHYITGPAACKSQQ